MISVGSPSNGRRSTVNGRAAVCWMEDASYVYVTRFDVSNAKQMRMDVVQ